MKNKKCSELHLDCTLLSGLKDCEEYIKEMDEIINKSDNKLLNVAKNVTRLSELYLLIEITKNMK